MLLLWCGVASWPRIWFVFRLRRDNFRKEYKEKHPDVKQVSMIGKAGGEKWKSMSDAQVLCSCTRLAPSPARWSFLRRPA
ncbi:HMG1/2-like protein isoform X1 [Aegilops tauschii subsp. strangulata]|uniref:HMG box domain-containing protein n=1 Tax=Aegilops tauschii subsp. strangulata TaxID=200361 RepID=A0A452ZK31_AEGTS